VLVNEPSEAQTLEILRGLRPGMEAHHALRIPDEVLESAVSLSARYVSDRQLPDKAIDLLDQACSRTVLHDQEAPHLNGAADADEFPDETAIEEAIRAGDYARAKQLHDRRNHQNNGGEPQ
jgi:ATP-dependent Clp protease ATP-binding subunit ClpC